MGVSLNERASSNVLSPCIERKGPEEVSCLYESSSLTVIQDLDGRVWFEFFPPERKKEGPFHLFPEVNEKNSYYTGTFVGIGSKQKTEPLIHKETRFRDFKQSELGEEYCIKVLREKVQTYLSNRLKLVITESYKERLSQEDQNTLYCIKDPFEVIDLLTKLDVHLFNESEVSSLRWCLKKLEPLKDSHDAFLRELVEYYEHLFFVEDKVHSEAWEKTFRKLHKNCLSKLQLEEVVVEEVTELNGLQKCRGRLYGALYQRCVDLRVSQGQDVEVQMHQIITSSFDQAIICMNLLEESLVTNGNCVQVSMQSFKNVCELLLERREQEAKRVGDALIQEERVSLDKEKKKKDKRSKRKPLPSKEKNDSLEVEVEEKTPILAPSPPSPHFGLVMQKIPSLFKEAQRVLRWGVKDLETIRGFQDRNKKGEVVFHYKEYSQDLLQKMRDVHQLYQIQKVLAYEASDGVSAKWSFQTERGVGLFAKMMIGEKSVEGVIYIGKGDREKDTIIHQMFEEKDFNSMGLDVSPLKKGGAEVFEEVVDDSEWEIAISDIIRPIFKIDEVTNVISVIYHDKIKRRVRPRRFDIFPLRIS